MKKLCSGYNSFQTRSRLKKYKKQWLWLWGWMPHHGEFSTESKKRELDLYDLRKNCYITISPITIKLGFENNSFAKNGDSLVTSPLRLIPCTEIPSDLNGQSTQESRANVGQSGHRTLEFTSLCPPAAHLNHAPLFIIGGTLLAYQRPSNDWVQSNGFSTTLLPQECTEG